jgi:hypothetical protein
LNLGWARLLKVQASLTGTEARFAPRPAIAAWSGVDRMQPLAEAVVSSGG